MAIVMLCWESSMLSLLLHHWRWRHLMLAMFLAIKGCSRPPCRSPGTSLHHRLNTISQVSCFLPTLTDSSLTSEWFMVWKVLALWRICARCLCLPIRLDCYVTPNWQCSGCKFFCCWQVSDEPVATPQLQSDDS